MFIDTEYDTWNMDPEALEKAFELYPDIVQLAVMAIGEFFSTALTIITLPFQFIWENCKEIITTAWEAIKGVVTTAVEAIKTGITNAWNAVKTTTSTIFEAVKTVVTTVWTAIKTALDPIINGIKTAVSTAWEAIKTATSTAFNAVKTTASTVWNGIKTTVTTVVNGVKTAVSTAWNGIKTVTSTVFNAVKTAASTAWNAIKTTITTVVNSIKTAVSSGLNAVKSTVSSILNGIKSTFTSVFNGVWSFVQGIVNKLKGIFNFSWSLPHIKLPHFSISGSFSLNPPSIPHISVDWYRKAMNNGMILNSPTIFGRSGNHLLGGGEEYKRAIRKQTRKFEWQGTITTTNGKVYHFTTKDIVKGSGTLTRSCAGSTSLELGSVYAAELDISLFLDVDRYSLYDAVIDLSFVCRHSVKRVWNDLRPFTWGAMRTKRWNDRGESETIPMGKFVVSEATRTLTVLQLKAYDYMLKFDKNMKNSGTVRTPYEWLKYACEACSVPLGVTEEAVAAMPNGTRSLSWTNLDEDKTWRDLIAHVATVLCGVCQIDRSGALTVIPFTNTPVMDIPASWRYSSKIADYITKYTGLYATYRAGGLTEYYNVEPDDGLIYNIGTNPFTQIAATAERSRVLQAIINNLAATTYTPFEADIPGDPSLDPMDVLSLSGGQATGEIACITEIVYRINGKSHIKCVGENPRLNQAKSRYTKDIEGLLAQNEGIEGTSTFWMSDAYSAADMAVTEEAVVTATQFEIQTDKSRGEIIWTGTYTLDEPSVVTANVYLDDRLIYSCRDWRMAGNTTLTVSTPFEIQRGDEGVHEVRIALKCEVSEESDLTILMRQLASLENRVRQLEEGFMGEIEVEEVIHGELAEMIGRIDTQALVNPGTSGAFTVNEPVHLELMAMLGGITENAEGET